MRFKKILGEDKPLTERQFNNFVFWLFLFWVSFQVIDIIGNEIKHKNKMKYSEQEYQADLELLKKIKQLEKTCLKTKGSKR